jgi:hypothetical protein
MDQTLSHIMLYDQRSNYKNLIIQFNYRTIIGLIEYHHISHRNIFAVHLFDQNAHTREYFRSKLLIVLKIDRFIRYWQQRLFHKIMQGPYRGVYPCLSHTSWTSSS